MKKILKTNLLIIVSLLFFSCNSSKRTINDLMLLNYFGSPKKIIAISNSNGRTYKRIEFYEKRGYLTKIEYYNLTKSDEPNKLFLSEVTTYDFIKDVNKRMSKTTNATTKKVESESIFEKKSDNLYQRTTKFKNSDFNKDDYIKRLYHFDKNNRVIKKEDVGQIRNFEIKENAQIFYSKNHYDYVIFENKISNTKSKVIYKNKKYDKMNNLIYFEVVDEKGNIIEKEERKIEYY